MTVQYLIEELQKLPPNTLQQEVVVAGSNHSGWQSSIATVRWQGNRVVLEIGGRYA